MRDPVLVAFIVGMAAGATLMGAVRPGVKVEVQQRDCRAPTPSEYRLMRSWTRPDGQVVHQCERFRDVYFTKRDLTP